MTKGQNKLSAYFGILMGLSFLGLTLTGCSAPEPIPDNRPNILLVLTDDQGYSDVGFNGNPDIRTPVLDAFSETALVFDQFYTQPVCSPTRAALMTGQHPFRSGVTDTQAGAALLPPSKTTIAEALSTEGYTTGLFGKWHLGDNAPMRPQDQGFDQVLTHDGGMIGTWYSPPGGRSYFDPILWNNGERERFTGYAPDIFTDAAIEFVTGDEDAPFFAFLSFNTPHHPLTVSDAFADSYRQAGFSEETARYYGMIENIDHNFGRVLNALEGAGKLDDTIVVFLSDNGTSSLHQQDDLWESGLRGRKTYVYENGIRVPMFIRLPMADQREGRTSQIAVAEDLMPTLLEAVGIQSNIAFDGDSLLPYLKEQTESLSTRTLFFQFHRGAQPEPYRNIAVRSGNYKLVQPVGRGIEPYSAETATYELYDLHADPTEKTDISEGNPERVAELVGAYETWARDLPTDVFEPRPIWIGSPSQNPVILSRQDWWDRSMSDGLTAPYQLEVKTAGTYRLTFRWNELLQDTYDVTIKLGDQVYQRQILRSELEARIEAVDLETGPLTLEAWIDIDGQKSGFRYIEIEHQAGGSDE